MALSLMFQAALTLFVGTLGIGLWMFLPLLIEPFRSSFLNIPGPPAQSWLLGSLSDIYESDGEVICDEWIENYGRTIMYRGFFSVGSCEIVMSLGADSQILW